MDCGSLLPLLGVAAMLPGEQHRSRNDFLLPE